MNVDDMDDNHVRNAFKMLLRNIQSANTKRPIGNIESNFIEDAIKEIEDDWIEEYNNGLWNT